MESLELIMHLLREANVVVTNSKFSLISTQVVKFFFTTLFAVLGLEAGIAVGDYVYHNILNYLDSFHGSSNLRTILGALFGGFISGVFTFLCTVLVKSRKVNSLYFGTYALAILIHSGSTIFLGEDYLALKFWIYNIGLISVTYFSLLFVLERTCKPG